MFSGSRKPKSEEMLPQIYSWNTGYSLVHWLMVVNLESTTCVNSQILVGVSPQTLCIIMRGSRFPLLKQSGFEPLEPSGTIKSSQHHNSSGLKFWLCQKINYIGLSGEMTADAVNVNTVEDNKHAAELKFQASMT